MFAIAEAIGCPLYELEEDMPPEEVFEWTVYWKIKHEAEERARKAAEAKAGKGRRKR